MIELTAVAAGVVLVVVASRVLAPGRPRRPVSLSASERPARSLEGLRRLAHVGRRPSRAVRPTPLAAWADDLARTLRHGSTLRAALTTVVPDDPTIARHSEPLRHRLGRGATAAEACDDWSNDIAGLAVERGELLATAAAVLAAAAALGGSAAAPLDRLASALRQRASDDLERSAQSAQARMSARVLTLVPVGVLTLLVATDETVRDVVTQPTGATVVLIGLVLNAIGSWWMRRIVGHADDTSTT